MDVDDSDRINQAVFAQLDSTRLVIRLDKSLFECPQFQLPLLGPEDGVYFVLEPQVQAEAHLNKESLVKNQSQIRYSLDLYEAKSLPRADKPV